MHSFFSGVRRTATSRDLGGLVGCEDASMVQCSKMRDRKALIHLMVVFHVVRWMTGNMNEKKIKY